MAGKQKKLHQQKYPLLQQIYRLIVITIWTFSSQEYAYPPPFKKSRLHFLVQMIVKPIVKTIWNFSSERYADNPPSPIRRAISIFLVQIIVKKYLVLRNIIN